MPDQSYNVRRIIEEMELELVRSLRTELARDTELDDYEDWKSMRLQNLRKFKMDNIRIINKYNKPIISSIEVVLLDMYRLGQKRFNELAAAAARAIRRMVNPPATLRAILVNYSSPAIEPQFFRINDYKFNALIEAIQNDFENASAAVLRRMDDIYRQTIFRAQTYYNMGQVDLKQAIDMATHDFRARGIDAITYADGKRVNIASYAEMSLRTANHRAYLMGEGKRRAEMGLPLVVVSAHATTCELCSPWQGQVLIDDVYAGFTQDVITGENYPRLSEAMSEGLLHPNCRHNLSTYFLGITTLPQVPDVERALDNYEAEQQQRYIERQIRKYKRLRDGAVSSTDRKRYAALVQRWQGIMRDFLKQNPQLRRDYYREMAY